MTTNVTVNGTTATVTDNGSTVVVTAASTSTPAWGSITGALANQADLSSALAAKAPLESPTFTGTGTSPAVKITNTGTGHSLLVEDEASTDPSPFVVTASGQVSIGPMSPTVSLQISSDSTAQQRIIRSSSDALGPSLYFVKRRGSSSSPTIVSSGDTVGEFYFLGYDGSGGQTVAGVFAAIDGTPGAGDMPGRMIFITTPDGSVTPAEVMRLNSGQEVLIGYTADNGAYKLQVNSQIFATSATIATSDGRYKENVETLDGGWDMVKALRPVAFDWKPQEPITDGDGNVVREGHNFPDGRHVGFIAQEVRDALGDRPWVDNLVKRNVRPEVIGDDGTVAPEEEFYGIAEGNLIAVLTSALQEAMTRIEALEARLGSA